MNPDRRLLLQSFAGAALFSLAQGPARAQSTHGIVPQPPRLRVAGAATPVQLRAVRIAAEISGRMALTSVELEFFNPNARVLEGELQFPLLEGQVVVGMAMEVDGALREAVPVDKARGEQVFEEVTRARIDPALLSATEGHNYKLRVYPLPAQGGKRVVIRYSETLAARGERLSYRLPLAYAERLAELSVVIRAGGAAAAPQVTAGALTLPAFVAEQGGHRFDWQARDLMPGGLLDVDFATARAGSIATGEWRGRHYFVAQLPVSMQRRPRPLPRVLALVWDSSGSGAERDHGREFALLDAWFARAREVEVRLQRVRNVAEPTQAFKVTGGDWAALRRALEGTVYDGATDLGAVTPDAAAGEVLLFSDGLSNFGTQRWTADKVPVFTISAALRNDPARLRGIAEASGGAFIDLLALNPAEARAALLERGTRLLRMASNEARHLAAASSIPDEGWLTWLTLAGELSERQAHVQLTLERADGERQPLELVVDAAAGAGALAAQTWARLQIAALQADEEAQRGEIGRLSREFGIVTGETSLIILDRAEDYARHDIPPPPELAKAVAALRAQAQQLRQHDQRSQLDQVAHRFHQKIAWWERAFPKDDWQAQKPPTAPRRSQAAQDGAAAERRVDAAPQAMPAVPAALAAPGGPMAGAGAAREARAKATGGAADQAPAAAVIRLRPATLDAAYARRMKTAPSAQLYRVYLDERTGQRDSTAFFLGAAELLFERGLAELGLRVLSNLAEMNLENRQVLRILAQRLIQAGQPRMAIPLLRKVQRLGPHEPQSYRDLGLALAADGQTQAAVDMLYEVVLRPWPRFPEIELIALAELNAIVAAQPPGLDSARIDRRLLRHLPLALRAVLSWDTDNTDVDLWVTDPNGEQAYYGNPLTHQGGRMSQDATGGYGPEEFSLRHAKPGVYKVEAQFYGHRQQIVSATTTIQLVLSTGFGTPRQVDKRVTLRLREPKERVFVGEFEVR